jgi:GntR family transcriptional regulator
VNPNTVARAYRDLQNDSVLETMRGEGLRVSREAAERCRKSRQRLLQERMTAVATEALQSGLTEEEFYGLSRQTWLTVVKAEASKSQAVSQQGDGSSRGSTKPPSTGQPTVSQAGD